MYVCCMDDIHFSTKRAAAELAATMQDKWSLKHIPLSQRSDLLRI